MRDNGFLEAFLAVIDNDVKSLLLLVVDLLCRLAEDLTSSDAWLLVYDFSVVVLLTISVVFTSFESTIVAIDDGAIIEH